MNDWHNIKAEDFIDFNPREHLPQGTTAKKVSMEKLQPFSRSIASYDIASFSGGTKFRNGDTIMARITPCLENGKTAQVNCLEDNEVGFGSTEFIVMRAKPSISDSDFIYYLATSPFFRNIAIQSMVGSSGRQRVQQSVLNATELFVPPLSEQIEIGRTLRSLDDKIENNTKINHHLDVSFEVCDREFAGHQTRQECVASNFEVAALYIICLNGRIHRANQFFKSRKHVVCRNEHSERTQCIFINGAKHGSFSIKHIKLRFQRKHRIEDERLVSIVALDARQSASETATFVSNIQISHRRTNAHQNVAFTRHTLGLGSKQTASWETRTEFGTTLIKNSSNPVLPITRPVRRLPHRNGSNFRKITFSPIARHCAAERLEVYEPRLENSLRHLL